MALSEGRIPQSLFKVLTGLCFGVSLLAALSRMIIRLRSQKRFYVDDYLLLFSCKTLTAGTGLLYYGTSAIYFAELLALDAVGAISSGAINPADISRQLILFQRINWSYFVLTWAAIFAVKFAFLSLFRTLVDRLRSIHMYWKVVVVSTALVFAFIVCDTFITCPKLGLESLDCAQPKALEKSLGLGATAICLDILTDLLLLVIPVSLLWRVQIKPRQKLGLALFLCLRLCMMIVAIIKIGGLHYHGTFDNTWLFLWHQVESCVAVTMVSLTAFRSLFVANASRRREKKEVSPWLPYTPKGFRSHRKRASDDRALDELTIPAATLTGMRTFIRGDRYTTSQIEDDSFLSDGWSSNGHKLPRISHHNYQSTSV